MQSMFLSYLALGRRGKTGKNNPRRIDSWKTFAQDVPPETSGYALAQDTDRPNPGPPTGLAANIYK